MLVQSTYDGDTHTGTIQNCYVVNSSVTASSYISGVMVGSNYAGLVDNSYSYESSRSANSRAGYFVGDNRDDNSALTGTITNCYADGSLQGTYSGTVSGGEASVSSDRFASGEIARALQDNKTDSAVSWGQYFDTDTYPTLSTDTGNQVVLITLIRVSGGTEYSTQYYYINPDKKLSDILTDDAFSDINLNNQLSADTTFSEDTTIYAAVYPDLDVSGGAYTYSDGLLTLTEGGEYTVSMRSGVDSISDTIKVTASNAVTVNLVGISISSGDAPAMEIDAAGDVTVTLSGDNTLTATGSYAGLQKTSTDNTLIITSAEGKGSTEGTLTATGGASGDDGAAGIGGGTYNAVDGITITGGTITAKGNGNGAGIGSGCGTTTSNITISGGYIKASSGTSNGVLYAGNSTASNISITGGYFARAVYRRGRFTA